MRRLFSVILLMLLCVNFGSYAAQEWYKPGMGFSGSKVRVLQTSYYDDMGKRSHIYALHFKIKSGWQIYGKKSEGVGIAPSLEFDNPKQISDKIIYWPKSIDKAYSFGDKVLYYDVYENELVLPFELFGDIENGSVVKFNLSYGVCNKVCVPVNNEISFVIDKRIKENDFYFISPSINDFKMNLSYDDGTLDSARSINEQKADQQMGIAIIYALFAAFIGGLILNVMPCVLPVLSIKLLSILKNHRFNVETVRASFAYTVVGILTSFLIFGIFVSGVSYSGEVFNWGLQFQSPSFLVFLILVFVIFIANILGFFQISTSEELINYLGKKIDNNIAKRKIFAANFFSGFLAVLLATPCSAPFLGAAITFSVTQPPLFVLLIFITMGLGFAMPYFILMAFPNFIKFLPKTGPWTRILKNILAAFVFATAIWLCYVLYRNSGLNIALTVVTLSILLFLSFKLKSKLLKTLAIFTFMISILAAPTGFDGITKSRSNKYWQDSWVSFERAEISRYVAMDKTVVIDVTADWCLTCKYNKFSVLDSQEVKGILKQNNIVAMRADITKPDRDVMKFINSYNRYAIPFNLVIGPNAKGGILTSELLDQEELIAIIKKASK